jgi:outer membrane protein assembly factor BamA
MKNAATLLLLLFLTVPVRAEETARFLIERIDVRHLTRVSPDVIKAESRLREGQTYSENDLRAANNRVKRLPFVLDAAFSLERGSVRDAYVLVIAVNETRPLFYLFDVVPLAGQGGLLNSVGDDAVLGGRWFSGRRGVFHAAATVHEDDRPFQSSSIALQGGYTRYGLFNDRAFATLTVSSYVKRESGGPSGTTLPGGVLGVSLTPNHTLTISYSGADAGTASRRTERILESRFAYNTTNHPYFPTEGTLLSIAPVFAWIDGIDRTPFHIAFHDFDTALDAHGAHYWTLADRLTAAVTADGGVVRIQRRELGAEPEFNLAYGTAALSVWRAIGEANGETDQRIELTLRDTSRPREFVPLLRDTKTQFSAAWVRRNAWGVLRIGLGVEW